MGRLRFTERAESDLDSVAAHTLERWGIEQALRWRIEQGRHVVFFRRDDRGDVLVVRILHDRMLPELHLSEEPED